MSQMQGMYGDAYGQPMTEPPRTSGLAVGSLVCSVIFCCPLTTLLGPILGLAAIVSIGSNPMRRGKVLALLGIIIGLVATLGQVVAGKWGWDNYVAPSMQLVMEGPSAAIEKGYAGDIAGMKAQFYGRGAAATDDAASQFIAELKTRYGAFQGAKLDETGRQPSRPPFGQPVVVFPYVLTFDQAASVSADCELIFADQTTGAMVVKLGSITIKDTAKGDLTFP